MQLSGDCQHLVVWSTLVSGSGLHSSLTPLTASPVLLAGAIQIQNVLFMQRHSLFVHFSWLLNMYHDVVDRNASRLQQVNDEKQPKRIVTGFEKFCEIQIETLLFAVCQAESMKGLFLRCGHKQGSNNADSISRISWIVSKKYFNSFVQCFCRGWGNSRCSWKLLPASFLNFSDFQEAKC